MDKEKIDKRENESMKRFEFSGTVRYPFYYKLTFFLIMSIRTFVCYYLGLMMIKDKRNKLINFLGEEKVDQQLWKTN